MRLIKLEILNLASLDRQEGEVIHFEEGALKDSTIFSIVGPTGSGKSTLLDAICLALYNRAPRYPRKKGDRNQNIEIYGEISDGEKNRLAPTDCRNILTRGKKEGYSKLTFMANNGNLYRAEWHVKFMQVKYAPVITSLYKISNHQGKLTEEEVDWNTLPLIIGLDYEQFLRTVLIAQGSFANFLTAKENERYELLEKLIGCEDLYARISCAIKEQRDLAAKAFDTINIHFTTYEKELIAENELAALQEEIRQLEMAELKVKEELMKINEALTWYITENKHLTNLQQFQQNVTQALLSLEAAQGEFQRLKWHDETRPGMDLLRDIKTAEANLLLFKQKLDVLDKQMELQDNKIKDAEQILQHLKDEELKATQNLETQRPHINKARTLQGELEVARQSVKEKEKSQKSSLESLQKAELELKNNQSNIQQAKTKLEKTEKNFSLLQEQTNLKKTELDKAVKEAIEAFNAEQNKLEGVDANQLQQTKDKADQLRNNLKNAIHIQEDLVVKQELLKTNLQSYQQIMVENKQLEKENQELKVDLLSKELETLQKTHTLMTSENWTMHRHQLEEGKPCPLCGATAHPYTHHEAWIPVVNELQSMIHNKKLLLDKETMRKQQLTQALGVNHGKLQSLTQQQHTLQQDIDKLQKAWQELAADDPTWTPDVLVLTQKLTIAEKEAEAAAKALSVYHHTYAKADSLRKKMENNQVQQKDFTEQADLRLRNAEQLLTKINLYLQTELGKTNHLQQQVNEKTETWQLLKQEWGSAQELVNGKEKELKLEIGLYTPDELEKQLTEAKNKANEAVVQKTQDLTALRETLKGLHGQKEAMQNSLQQENGQLHQKKDDLDKWISTFNQESGQGPITLLNIEELYTATDNWEAIRRKQTALQTELTTARTTLTNEEKAHQTHQDQKPQQLQEELQARKFELEGQSNTALTDAKARLQRHEAAKQQMGKLFEQRQTALQEKQEWEEMTDAIGGDGKTLRKIAQCYTLRFLIEHANAEIRKFNNRYELQQVKNSLGIRVIDHDRADDIRDTTSLSGGETFIVSLGLALGLSALSSRNISFENLFIDEGFGTLDPDTLATVIDSLAMLQSSQGKKVGVISHTDTMSERITTQIRIIKNGNSGSSHLEIYP